MGYFLGWSMSKFGSARPKSDAGDPSLGSADPTFDILKTKMCKSWIRKSNI